MKKTRIDSNAFVYPMPVVLIGAMVKGKANFMTVAWVSRVNYRPAMIAFASGKAHYTNSGIKENKVFSVNVPGQSLIKETDRCGLVSGKNEDKSKMFEVFYGELKNAPMVEQCALSMECKLVDTVQLPSNTLFIGEIIAAFSEEKYLTEGKPDIEKIRPFTLSMPDNRYWSMGENIGLAWKVGGP
jgi:flavin reductase (DIM6/NTAB) family NADH-FMN oxidoreductase RutF